MYTSILLMCLNDEIRGVIENAPQPGKGGLFVHCTPWLQETAIRHGNAPSDEEPTPPVLEQGERETALFAEDFVDLA